MFGHHKRVMFKPVYLIKFGLFLFSVFFIAGCGVFSPKDKIESAKLLPVETASQADLMQIVNRFSTVNSIDSKIKFEFKDNSYAEIGVAEKFKKADGEIIVQRPGNIFLRVQIPVIKSDVVQMASDGSKFRVAILEDGAGGKYKKFVVGTNDVDYSALDKEVEKIGNGDAKELKQNVNAFKDMRPQHFTDAILVRPIDTEKYSYLVSTITQEEIDLELMKKKSPLAWVLRGYYLLEEFKRNDDGSLTALRRFWFDRTGKVRLARQQIFDAKGEIESDIIYGKEANLTSTGQYENMPVQIQLTRPKEKYSMSVEYLSPQSVKIGENFDPDIFVLRNRWDLQEVDLDVKLRENTDAAGGNSNSPNGTKDQ